MKAVKYWLKLVELPDNRLPKTVYETVKSLDDKGVKTWASDVRTCLLQYGFGIVWVSQQVGNKTGFLRELKQRLIDCNAQDCHDKISTKERFENDRGFQQILQFESYLSYLTVKRYRDAIVQIRLGVNELTCIKYRCNRVYCVHVPGHDHITFSFRSFSLLIGWGFYGPNYLRC